MIGLLEALEASGPAQFLRMSFVAYPVVNAGHILAIGALVTSVVLMDLRVLGAWRSIPIETLMGYLRPVAVLALVVAVITGMLLFSVRPLEYLDNPAFRVKLVLLAIAVANAVGFTLLQKALDLRSMPLRVLAGISLLAWPAALLAGRFIGFVE